MQFHVPPIERALEAALREKIDRKTKPVGALGRLEALAVQIGLIQQTLSPVIARPTIAVFAGDHGVTAENVSAYPSEVTAQMVLNFLAGGAAINVFARQHGIELKVVDAGVAAPLQASAELIDAKVATGTRNFLREPAMSAVACRRALDGAAELVSAWQGAGCNTIAFGDMGIGNTSSAAVLTSLLGELPLADCVGPGAGLENAGVVHKRDVLRRALARTGMDAKAACRQPLVALAEYGGYEIAMICGGMLRAAELGMLILVDGFIATSAFLVVHRLAPEARDYCVFTHRSAEWGHAPLLRSLDAVPLLDLEMRLGEGTGAAMAMPIVRCAVAFLNEMSSFADAAVSGKKE